MNKHTNNSSSLANFQENFSYTFRDIGLLSAALTHGSYRFKSNLKHGESYQRLEFLGDSVLELIVSNIIFDMWPDATEGQMSEVCSNITCNAFLAAIAKNNNIGSYIVLGESGEKSNCRNNSRVLADVVEALVGALYKDGGFGAAERFVRFVCGEYLENLQIPSKDKEIAQVVRA